MFRIYKLKFVSLFSGKTTDTFEAKKGSLASSPDVEVRASIAPPGRTPFPKFQKYESDSETDSCGSEQQEEYLDNELLHESSIIEDIQTLYSERFEHIPVLRTPKRHVSRRTALAITRRRIDFDSPEYIELGDLQKNIYKNTTDKTSEEKNQI
ncbi:uncharacterized protein LOC101738308 [Bombyx mori]|uniref:Uncharacterized protein n=1 Tax=Bombyx mori TaxID=7091 RepID=A0A8R2AIK6_BOMMO|nr:uncharacterized protein LOC101738308 [Bombyx mori]